MLYALRMCSRQARSFPRFSAPFARSTSRSTALLDARSGTLLCHSFRMSMHAASALPGARSNAPTTPTPINAATTPPIHAPPDGERLDLERLPDPAPAAPDIILLQPARRIERNR